MIRKEELINLDKKIKKIYSNNTTFNYIFYNIVFRVPLIIVFVKGKDVRLSMHLLLIFISYVLDQIIFFTGHISLHVNFIKHKNNYDNFGSYLGVAFIHHYYDPIIFHKLNFYNLTNSFLMTPFQKQYFLLDENNKYLNYIGLGFYLFLCSKMNFDNILLLCTFVCYILKIDRLVRINIFSIVSNHFNLLNKEEIIIFYCYQILVLLLQKTTHIWYHTPFKMRRVKFNISYYFYIFLENIGIISTIEHKKHHLHDINNLEKAELWNDIYVPKFINDYAEKYWQYKINNLNKSNNKIICKLKNYARIVIFVALIVKYNNLYFLSLLPFLNSILSLMVLENIVFFLYIF